MENQTAEKLRRFFDINQYLFFDINEDNGIKQMKSLTKSSCYNVLICNKEFAKANQILHV